MDITKWIGNSDVKIDNKIILRLIEKVSKVLKCAKTLRNCKSAEDGCEMFYIQTVTVSNVGGVVWCETCDDRQGRVPCRGRRWYAGGYQKFHS